MAAKQKKSRKGSGRKRTLTLIGVGVLFCCVVIVVFSWQTISSTLSAYLTVPDLEYSVPVPKLDILAYNQKMIALAGYGTTTADTGILATSTDWTDASSSIMSPINPWPVKTVYPNYGALLPFNRIVAYYGNYSSKAMGILGQYDSGTVLTMLASTTAQWQAADPSTHVIPGIDYIAVVAQGSPGADGKYRLRMSDTQIKKAIGMADQIHGIVILEVQPGLSNVQAEVPPLAEYLKLPNVELALDPEFSMKTGRVPGTVIGTMDATDINFAAHFLANLVDIYNLPPKVLIVHRFTDHMVTNYQNIEPLAQVQIVMNMDGWGAQPNKLVIYKDEVSEEPVQFGGIKLFYKNDLLPPSKGMLLPNQVLPLHPAPSFVQYQ